MTTDAERFRSAVAACWPDLRRVAQRIAGAAYEDVLQDSLVRAWRHWGRFDASRGSTRSWLLAIVANQARTTARRPSRTVALVDVAAPDRADRRAESDAAVATVDLERAIARLSDRQRLAVDLVYFCGLGLADAAVAMGCREGTVKATLARARAKLATLLGEEYR